MQWVCGELVPIMMAIIGILVNRMIVIGVSLFVYVLSFPIRMFSRIFTFIDSEQKSKDSYEDDYQYDGEREDSDVESTEPPSTR